MHKIYPLLTNGAFAQDVFLAAATYGMILWNKHKMKRFLTRRRMMLIPEDMHNGVFHTRNINIESIDRVWYTRIRVLLITVGGLPFNRGTEPSDYIEIIRFE